MSEGNIPGTPLVELTQDEKAYAGLAHALMIPTWWIAPLIIFFVKKESRFVKFHALQALFWEIIITVICIAGYLAMMASMFMTVLSMPQGQTKQPPEFPLHFFMGFIVFWVVMMSGMVISWVLGIMYCLKAMRGEWAEYPVIGRWARRIAGV